MAAKEEEEGSKPLKLPPKSPAAPKSTPKKKPPKLPPSSPSQDPKKKAVDGNDKTKPPPKLPPKLGNSKSQDSVAANKSTPSATPQKDKKPPPKLQNVTPNPAQQQQQTPKSKSEKGKRPSAANLTQLEPKPATTPTPSSSSIPTTSNFSKSSVNSRKPSLAPRASSTSFQKPTNSTVSSPRPPAAPAAGPAKTSTGSQSQSNLSAPNNKGNLNRPGAQQKPSSPSVPKSRSVSQPQAQPAKSAAAPPPPSQPTPQEPQAKGPQAPKPKVEEKEKEVSKPPLKKAESHVSEAKPSSRKPSRPPPKKLDSQPSIPNPPSRKPSMQAQASSTNVNAKPPGKPKGHVLAEEEDDVPAHKLSEENRNIKDILTESQCGDLTILIANITERMRQSIENAFDATAGLKLLKEEEKGKDGFAQVDFDPGTVDVGAYDKERKVQEEQKKELAKPQSQQLKKDALQWFDGWRQIVIQRVGEVVNSKKTASDQKDQAATGQERDGATPAAQRLQKINTTGKEGEYAPPKLEDLFPRIRTPLTKLPMAQRVLVLHSVFLLLLSLEHYNATSRVLLLYLTSSLKVGLNSLREDEEQTAQGLLEAAKQMTAEQEKGRRKAESQESRKWKIRLASAAGAAIIGYTGGMAAPMVAAGVGSMMGELGLGATTAASYLGAVAGNAAVVGSLFGAYGGQMTGQIMSNISAEVEDFAFLPVHGERKEHAESLEAATDKRRLRVIVAVSGWLLEKEEVVSPWRVLKPSAEVFALRFELETLMNLGQSFDTMLSSAAYSYAQSAVAKRTAFAELMSAMWPVALVKVARVVDNPFSLAKTRAEKAGEVLAEALMNRAQGERPVTLIGYSLGARVIWSCLMTLAKKRGFGFVESAVLMGSPVPSDINTWRAMRATVSGRLVNVYSENDYLLAFLYRSASLQYGVAGLMPITGLYGIENVDVSELVSGHLRYRYLVGSILDKIRFEDVDKEEVDKESKAFDAMIEKEKKNTYQKQLRDNAGTLYDQYGQRLGLPKEGRKLLPQKEEEVRDDKADKEASKMEKEIHQKTQKGLMQWAVEQLYISPPDAPSTDEAQNAAKNPEGAANKTTKDAKKTSDAATKSLYQRASEALYLTRSGGPEGEATAKDKVSKAQSGADEQSSSYLSYLPSLSSSSKKNQKPKDVPKRPSTLSKSKSKSRASTQKLKKPDGGSAGKTPEGKAADQPDTNATKDTPSKAQKAQDTAAKGQDEVKDVANGAAPESAGYSSYLPSFGLSSSTPKKAEQTKAEPPKTPPNQTDQDPSESQDKPNGQEETDSKDKKDDQKQANGYGSYLPSFGFGGSRNEEARDEGAGEAVGKDEEKGDDSNKAEEEASGKGDEKSNASKETSSYGSYMPSFGFGSRAETESKATEASEPNDQGPNNEKEDQKQTSDDATDAKSPQQEGDEKKEQAKKYPWEKVLEEDKAAESAENTSSYTSYIPSFGFGSSSFPKKEEGNEGESEKPDQQSQEKGDDAKQHDTEEKEGKEEATEDQPKKRYPWKIATENQQ